MHRILPDGIIVQDKRIIGTDILVFEAWKPTTAWDEFSTGSHIRSVWCGKVGTERFADDLRDMPERPDTKWTNERAARVYRFYATNHARAYCRIFEAFPHLLTRPTYCSMGDVTIHLPLDSYTRLTDVNASPDN